MKLLGGTPKRGSFGFTHPDKDLESMCQSCKNEDTKRLMPMDSYYDSLIESGKSEFRAYSCHCCGASWWHSTI